MIATSEITCAGLFANEVIQRKDLPKKFLAFSHCYRKEAGQGQYSKGLYRLHQFSKLEMFAFTENSLELSNKVHEEFLSIQEELYTDLKLHFKIYDMPTSELGASAYRKYDIEAYFPSKKDFGEISSTSNCTDFQSARLNCLYFDKNNDKKLMHTINGIINNKTLGTAIAVPRLIMAILENFQTKNGKVIIPEVLHPFCFGLKVIG